LFYFSVRRFICDQCGATTKRSQELIRHKRLIHTEERNFVCEICERGFVEQWQLQKHMKIHGNQKDFECTEEGCTKTFRFSANLSQHMKIHKVS